MCQALTYTWGANTGCTLMGERDTNHLIKNTHFQIVVCALREEQRML